MKLPLRKDRNKGRYRTASTSSTRENATTPVAQFLFIRVYQCPNPFKTGNGVYDSRNGVYDSRNGVYDSRSNQQLNVLKYRRWMTPTLPR